MNVFGTSRFTALLAAIALSGTAGTFWWALETRSDMKAAASNRVVSRSVPVKAGGRAPRWKDDHASKADGTKFDANKSEPAKVEPGKFELMGKSERPPPNLSLGGAAGRDDNTDRAPDRSIAPRLVNFPSPAPGYQIPGQGPAPGQGSSPGPQSGRADMPLPAMPARLDPARLDPARLDPARLDPARLDPARLDPARLGPARLGPAPAPVPMPSWQANRAAAPLAFASPAPVQPPPPTETLKRQTRETRPEPPTGAPAARQPKTPSFYTEQFIEQGEFRYRRRPCEPPNMPDVCYMPQADRHPIVVAKP
jgi:hypothetical protein